VALREKRTLSGGYCQFFCPKELAMTLKKPPFGSTVYCVNYHDDQPYLRQAVYVSRRGSWHTFRGERTEWSEHGFYWHLSPYQAWIRALEGHALIFAHSNMETEPQRTRNLVAVAVAMGQYFLAHPPDGNAQDKKGVQKNFKSG
jgi:hypothetical protein